MKHFALSLFFLLSCVALTLCAYSDAREWKVNTTVDGEFESLSEDGTKAVIHRTNGKTVRIPLTDLSEEDREYIKQQTQPQRDEPVQSGDEVTTEQGKQDSNTPKAGVRMVKTVNNIEFAFRWCPAGTFMMGSPEDEKGRAGNETQHKVTLTSGFWIMETEVTQKQWYAVMGTTIKQQRDKLNPKYFLFGEGDNYPMYYISWNECQEFCKKCTNLGFPVCLPTEAQWEYACRAGSTTAYFWGNSLNGDNANCNGNKPCGTTTKGPDLGKTTPVKNYLPNEWGLYDMHGNVLEWCEDWFEAYYSSGSVTNPVGPSNGIHRVVRGGGYISDAQDCRSAYRFLGSPEDSVIAGFRVVLKSQSDKQTSSKAKVDETKSLH